MKKRIVSLLLCAGLFLGSIPAAAEDFLSAGDEGSADAAYQGILEGYGYEEQNEEGYGELLNDYSDPGPEMQDGYMNDSGDMLPQLLDAGEAENDPMYGELLGDEGQDLSPEGQAVGASTDQDAPSELLTDPTEDTDELFSDGEEQTSEAAGMISGEEGQLEEDTLTEDKKDVLSASDDQELLSAGEDPLSSAPSAGEEPLIGGAGISVNVGSADWVATGGGFRLKKPGGSGFYTSADGLLYVKTKVGGRSFAGYYMFGSDGIMITGHYTMKAGTPGYSYPQDAEFYFANAGSAVFYRGLESNVKTPLNSNIGQSYRSKWLYENGRFLYFLADGRQGTVAFVKTQDEVYKKYGYFEINGGYYLLDDDGTPATGLRRIKGHNYYFLSNSAIPGRMAMGSWRRFSGSKGEKWLFFRAASAGDLRGTQVVHKTNYITRIPQKGSGKYLLDHNGYLLKGRVAKCEDGKTYGSNTRGEILRSKVQKYGKNYYYFTSSGALSGWKNSWRRVPAMNNYYYYFGRNAGRIEMKTGWQRVTNPNKSFVGWFLFRSSGRHYRNQWVGHDYYFDNYGRLASGLKIINGNGYFFAVSDYRTHRGKLYRSTVVNSGGKVYYAQANGRLYKEGLIAINGGYYAFKDYAGSRDTFGWDNGRFCYVDGVGRLHYKYVIFDDENNKVKFIDPNGSGFYKNCSAVIDGLRLYFDADGFRINDVTDLYPGPYYVMADRVNCVMTIYTEDRTVPVKSIRISPGAEGTETPLGTYYLESSNRWELLMGPSWGQYGVNVVGAGNGGIFIHSVPGDNPDNFSVPQDKYNQLGYPASHGCIRCCVADVKWVYEHCNGATITIFDGEYSFDEAMKGPLGRRKLVPITSNYDPTDPEVVG